MSREEKGEMACFLLCTMESPVHALVLRGCVNSMVSVRAERYLPNLMFRKLCACVCHFHTAHFYHVVITLIPCCAFMYNEHGFGRWDWFCFMKIGCVYNRVTMGNILCV